MKETETIEIMIESLETKNKIKRSTKERLMRIISKFGALACIKAMEICYILLF